MIFPADGLRLSPADTDDLFIQLHFIPPEESQANSSGSRTRRYVFQRFDAEAGSRPKTKVLGCLRAPVEGSSVMSVPDVQPAHPTAEPAVSSHFRNIPLSPAARSSLLSSLTHTNKNKMSQMSAAWRESKKPTRRTLMKNKSLLNPI